MQMIRNDLIRKAKFESKNGKNSKDVNRENKKNNKKSIFMICLRRL